MSTENSTFLLKTLNSDAENPTESRKKIPRKVVHCSDGIYEEYSTDEEEIEEQKRQEQEQRKRALIDPKTLSWGPWIFHMSWLLGTGLLNRCDHYGEKLAWFFGITSPKYYWEIQEFKKMKEEEAERQKQEAENTSGWNCDTKPKQVLDQPQ